MGPQKKRQSLSDKDARLFETLLRVSVQIVWLALGRRSFHQIGDCIFDPYQINYYNPVNFGSPSSPVGTKLSTVRPTRIECH